MGVNPLAARAFGAPAEDTSAAAPGWPAGAVAGPLEHLGAAPSA